MAEFIESTQSGKVINVDYLEDVRLKQVDTSYYITFIYSNGETFDEIYTDSTTAQNRYNDIVQILTTASSGVSDVQIDSTSIVSDGVANIPIATTGNLGVVTASQDVGTYVRVDGAIGVADASVNEIQIGTSLKPKALTVQQLSRVAFYGLAHAAGANQGTDETLYPVGTYTNQAVESIRNMLKIVAIEETDYASLLLPDESTYYMVVPDGTLTTP